MRSFTKTTAATLAATLLVVAPGAATADLLFWSTQAKPVEEAQTCCQGLAARWIFNRATVAPG